MVEPKKAIVDVDVAQAEEAAAAANAIKQECEDALAEAMPILVRVFLVFVTCVFQLLSVHVCCCKCYQARVRGRLGRGNAHPGACYYYYLCEIACVLLMNVHVCFDKLLFTAIRVQ